MFGGNRLILIPTESILHSDYKIIKIIVLIRKNDNTYLTY